MHPVRNIIFPFTLFMSLMLALSGCTAPEGNADDGKRWYMMHNCYSCHGLRGNDGKAPEIEPDHLSFRKFLSAIRNAGSPIMPKFPEEKISKQDAADMYAWLSENMR